MARAIHSGGRRRRWQRVRSCGNAAAAEPLTSTHVHGPQPVRRVLARAHGRLLMLSYHTVALCGVNAQRQCG